MTLSRRIFLRHGIATLAAIGSGPMLEPRFLARAAAAAGAAGNPPGRKVLVCVFQRGAADGLSMVAPFGDPHYYKLRQEIAVPAPAKEDGKGNDAKTALDLDGYFGLHPRLDALVPIWKRNELAVVHACGSPSSSRSHFDMQDFMEAGVADDKSVTSGWANRLLAARTNAGKPTPFRAVAMSGNVPRTLQGELDALAIRDLSTFGLRDDAGAPRLAAAGNSGASGGSASRPGAPDPSTSSPGAPTPSGFEGLYASAVDETLGNTGKESFDAIARLKKANPAQYKPAGGAKYPAAPLGQALLQVAQLIKADLGVEVAFVEDEGWDTHASQGGAFGLLAGKLMDFGRALAAFDADLGDRMADVTVLTMSEFGRAVRQNGNRGTDHGHGTCFLAFGGGVRGGRAYADWPTLAPEKLFEGRDLAVTTDFRDVFGEVCVRHFGVNPGNLGKVFPRHAADPSRFRGFMKG